MKKNIRPWQLRSRLLAALMVFVLTATLNNTAYAQGEVLEARFRASADSYAIIDFLLPSAGKYEFSIYPEEEDVGGVAQIFSNKEGELYFVDFYGNFLAYPFEVSSGGEHSLIVQLDETESPQFLNLIIEPKSNTNTGSVIYTQARVSYITAKKGKTVNSSSANKSSEVNARDSEFSNVYSYIKFADQKAAFDPVFGTGWRNIFGLWSKDGKSPLSGTFSFKGKLDKGLVTRIYISEILKNGQISNQKFRIARQNIREKAGITTVEFTTDQGIIRGNSLYKAIFTIQKGTGGDIIYRNFATLSLDYKMSLKCSSSLLALTLTRDTSKGFLQAVSLTANAVNGVVSDIVQGSPISKIGFVKRNKILNKLLKYGELQAAGDAASLGLDLIDFSEAVAEGNNVRIKAIVKGKITDKVKEELKLKTTSKTGQFVLNVVATRDEALDFVDFLANQGAENGDLISTTCSN